MCKTVVNKVYTFSRIARPPKRFKDIQRLSNFQIRQLLEKALEIAKNGEIKPLTPYLYLVGDARVLKHENRYFCLSCQQRRRIWNCEHSLGCFISDAWKNADERNLNC